MFEKGRNALDNEGAMLAALKTSQRHHRTLWVQTNPEGCPIDTPCGEIIGTPLPDTGNAQKEKTYEPHLTALAPSTKFDTLTEEKKGMSNKPIDWRGSSLRDLKDDEIFTPAARKEAGYQLEMVQAGLEPDDWKPFDVVGAGTKEIRINLDDGWFRVMYVAKFEEAVYVLHCFRKKTTSTSKHDRDITSARYRAVILQRSKK